MTPAAPLRVGLPAPEFDLPCALPSGGRATVRLSDFRGHWVAFLFYPRDFSMVCPAELAGTRARVDGERPLHPIWPNRVAA